MQKAEGADRVAGSSAARRARSRYRFGSCRRHEVWVALANGAVAAADAWAIPRCRETARGDADGLLLRRDRPLPVERDGACRARGHRAQRVADEQDHRAQQADRGREHEDADGVRPALRIRPFQARRARVLLTRPPPRRRGRRRARLVCRGARRRRHRASRARARIACCLPACARSGQGRGRAVSESRWPVGSSQRSSSGSCASARAIATR